MYTGKSNWTEKEKRHLDEAIKRDKDIRQNYDWNWSIFYGIISLGLFAFAIKYIL